MLTPATVAAAPRSGARVRRDIGHRLSDSAAARSQRDRAYESLRRLLILRQVPEGQRLREVPWSERLGVNRTALREALSRLHSEGLVVEGEKTGYLVPVLTDEDRGDILEARLVIEVAAVERIIARGACRRENLAPLRKLCEELEWMLQRDYALELCEADHRFHDALIRLAANQRLEQVYRCLPHVGPPDMRLAPRECIAQARQMLADHRELLEAMQARRSDAAGEILRRHYRLQGG